MEMHDLLKKISDLSILEESKKEETHKGGTKSSDDGVTKHKGKYGTEYQGDEDDETEDGKKKKKAKDAEAPKRGRGRPRKDADSSTGQVAKYDNAKNLQSFMVGNIPKKGLPGKASKKHTLKDWIEAVDNGMLAEAQTTLKPGQVGITNPDGSTTVLQTRDTSPAGQATTKFIQAQANAGKIFAPPTANTATNQDQQQNQNQGQQGQQAAKTGQTGGVVASMSETDGERKTGKKLFKKPGVMVKGKKSVEEADVPSRDATASPLSNTSREAPEKSAKKPASKSSKKSEWKNAFHEGKKAKPDFADIDDDGNEKETMKSAAKSAKAKKAVKEGHDIRQSAYHEGKCHAFENGHYRCRYDEGSDEHKHYHRGFVEGLEECYGGSMMEEGSDMFRGKPDAEVLDTKRLYGPQTSAKAIGRQSGIAGSAIPTGPRTIGDKLKGIGQGIKGFMTGGPEPVDEELDEEAFLSELDALDEEYGDIEEMNKTQYMQTQARKTPGDTFKAFGQTMHDKDVLETDGMNELDIQMESWDRALKGLLTEGITVSTSTGQKGTPDSVSISATDEDAHKLLHILSNAGMGIGSPSRPMANVDGDYRDEEHDTNSSFSVNVEPEDCEVVEPYGHGEVTSALVSGGRAMSDLRSKLLALESKSAGMEMPDGNGFSVQTEEDEPHDTPDATEPYDYDAVQGALEKGGNKISTDKKGSKKSEDSQLSEGMDSMPMPDGKGFSVPGEAKEKMEDGPQELDVTDIDDVLSDLEEKDTYQQDEFERAFSKLKSMIQSQMGGESKSKSAPKSDDSDSEPKAESAPESDSESEGSDYEPESSSEEDHLKEGSERCDECGAMYEGSHEDHTCESDSEKLDEWANSRGGKRDPGQFGQETFTADPEYMINTITGGLNGKKSDQTVNPHTRVKVAESRDSLSDWIKLSGIR